jgi:Tfp pilus assembly protein PilF
LTSAGHRSSEIYNLLGWCLYQQDDFKAQSRLDQAIAAVGPTKRIIRRRHDAAGTASVRRAMAAADKALEVAPDSYRTHTG